MANQYVNKVDIADGTTVIDISDTTATASDVAAGKYFYLATGEKVVGTLDVLNTFYPVGTVITTTNSSAPAFGGTWTEVKIVRTLSDMKTGNTHHETGTGSGTLHYWQRTA